MSYILIVDDDANSRKLLSANLEKRGHHTVAVPRLTHAVFGEQEMEENPDLILVGINAPHHRGAADLERLRSLPDTALTPTLVLGAEPPDRQWMARWGVGSCLLKPFDIRQLLVWLRPWLDNNGGTDAKRYSVLRGKNAIQKKQQLHYSDDNDRHCCSMWLKSLSLRWRN